MSERDDERPLRDAVARLRAEEARSAPTLAQLLARAAAARPRRSTWRFALPVAGAALAALATLVVLLVVRARAPAPAPSDAALVQLGSELAAGGQRSIALGSLRSPTDVLLAPPLPPRALPFSSSLIPAPPSASPARGEDQSSSPVSRRYPA